MRTGLETSPLERDRFGLSLEHAFGDTQPKPFPVWKAFFNGEHFSIMGGEGQQRKNMAGLVTNQCNTALQGRGRYQ